MFSLFRCSLRKLMRIKMVAFLDLRVLVMVMMMVMMARR